MPRYEFVEPKAPQKTNGRSRRLISRRILGRQQQLISPMASPRSPASMASPKSPAPMVSPMSAASAYTNRTARTGTDRESLYVPSFSPSELEDNTPIDVRYDNGLETSQQSLSTANYSYETESCASSILDTDDEGTVTEWVTTIDYHPRGGETKLTTTIVRTPEVAKLLMENEPPILDDDDEVTADLVAAHNHYEKIVNRTDLPSLEDSSGNAPNPEEQPFVESVVKRVANALWLCAGTEQEAAAETNNETTTIISEQELGEALANMSSDEMEDSDDDDDDEEEGYYETDDNHRDEKEAANAILNVIDTYESTVGDETYGSYSSTGDSDDDSEDDDDTRTYDDETTVTFHDRHRRSSRHYGTSLDDDDDDESVSTYNDHVADVTTMDEDATTFSFNDHDDEDEDDFDQRDDDPETGVSNEDSSYGSHSFRSPLSGSYEKSISTHHKKMSIRSVSMRSPNQQPRLSFFVDDERQEPDSADSLSYTKSRTGNRTGHALINSFITLKNSSSSHHEHQQQQQHPSPKNDVAPVFTVGTEKQDGYYYRVIETNDEQNDPHAANTVPTPKASNNNNNTNAKSFFANKDNKDISSKTVKITVTKTTRSDTNEEPFFDPRLRRRSAFSNAIYSHTEREDSDKSPTITSANDDREGPEPEAPIIAIPEREKTRQKEEPPPQSPTRHTKSPIFRSKGPLLVIDPATMPSEYVSDGNFSPLARLRNPNSYDVLSCD